MQILVADYLDFRYTGWPEVVRAGQGTTRELLGYLREWFGLYGGPEEMTTEGGPHFMCSEAKDFFTNWGVQHHFTWACDPHSNMRAETAIKTVKRFLMDNTRCEGSLYTDKFLAALLQ